MQENILIHIESTQVQDDGTPDSIDLMCDGLFYERDGKYYIKYKETELTGMEGASTLLKIDGEQISMTRFGTSNTHFVFQKGQVKSSYYETPYGSFLMMVSTRRAESEMGTDSGRIYLEYGLDIS